MFKRNFQAPWLPTVPACACAARRVWRRASKTARGLRALGTLAPGRQCENTCLHIENKDAMATHIETEDTHRFHHTRRLLTSAASAESFKSSSIDV